MFKKIKDKFFCFFKKRIYNNVLSDSSSPRIIQVVTALSYGDAVGNDIIAIKKFLTQNNIINEIFTTWIHPKLDQNIAKYIKDMPNLKKDDILIYHFAGPQEGLDNIIKKLQCKKVIRYHNITPPEFFEKYDKASENFTKLGLNEIDNIKEKICYCLADSEFNKQDLIKIGYSCPIDVIPILINFSDYLQEANKEIISKYLDNKTNIIFVGRVAPNKKIEDVISSFAFYKKTYNPNARLFLVGSYNENDNYYKMLKNHEKNLNVNDVIFTGHILFADILAYYKIANIFLCMSEHEGFDVPLVEAMYFGVPIVAYNSTAIPETLKESGILLDDKSQEKASMLINKIVKDDNLRNEIINKEKLRLKDFDNVTIFKQLLKSIEKIENI